MKGFKDSVSVATPTSHHHKLPFFVNTSADFYQFRPVFCEEMYPTEHFKVGVADYFRADPIGGPAFGNIQKKYAAFFVPYRILWDDWNNFITGGSNGRLEPSIPQFNYADLQRSLQNLYEHQDTLSGSRRNLARAVYRNTLDYLQDLGVPVDAFALTETDSLPSDNSEHFNVPLLRLLACRAIWFDWYRDQNLIGDDMRETYCPSDDASIPTDPHVNPANYLSFRADNIFAPPPVCYEKDYFTTALKEPQRGNSSFVPVSLVDSDVNPGFPITGSATSLYANGSNSKVYKQGNYDSANDLIGQFDYNLVRIAKGVQRYLEKNNIAGGADLQQLLAHWGTAPNPAVFNRSTYIGSFVDQMPLMEVVSPTSTAQDQAGSIVSKLNGASKGNFEYTANEHGFFIIVQTIRFENSYVGGFPREVLHGVLGNGRFDFGTPELEATGCQPLYYYELNSDFANPHFEHLSKDHPFGFVPRYAELKRKTNRITGQMSYLYDNLSVAFRKSPSDLQIDDNNAVISTPYTTIYCYTSDLNPDKIFVNSDPLYDHLQGWIYFDFEKDSPFHEYSSPLIEDSKGDDITLPYAGVRL